MNNSYIDISGILCSIRSDNQYIESAESILKLSAKSDGRQYFRPFRIEEAKSLLIYLVLDSLQIGEQSDILLCAWGLLKGYEYGKDLTQRRKNYLGQREKYVADFVYKIPFNQLSEKQQKSRADALRTKEDELCNIISNHYNSIVNKIPYIEKASKEFIITGKKAVGEDLVKYPTPSYVIKFQNNEIPLYHSNLSEIINLPLENAFFCGRHDILDEIDKNFSNGIRWQVLSGMGGMGKTQTALKYAYNHLETYSLIHWVNGNNLETIFDDYKRFLKTKQLTSNDLSIDSVCNSYTSYMDSHSDWLIIFDNCGFYSESEFDTFKNLCLPKNPSTGHILFTSRSNRRIRNSSVIDIYTLSEEDSIEFLLKRTATNDMVAAGKLAKRLGFFPLAMEIAGAYVYATPGCSIEQYLAYLNKSSKILDTMIDVTDYSNTIKEVILLTIERIESDYKDSKLIRHLIYLSSYNDPREINYDYYALLSEKRKEFPEGTIGYGLFKRITANNSWEEVLSLASHCRMQEWRDEATRIVTKYGIMKYDTDHLEMHELEQEVIRVQIIDNDFWKDVDTFARYEYFTRYEELVRTTINTQLEEILQDPAINSDDYCSFSLSYYAGLASNEFELYPNLLDNKSSKQNIERCFIRFLVSYEEYFRFYKMIDDMKLAKNHLGLFLHYNTYILRCYDDLKRNQNARDIFQIALDSISFVVNQYGVEYVSDINYKLVIDQTNTSDNISLLSVFYYDFYCCLMKLVICGEMVWLDDSEENLKKAENALKLLQIYKKKYWHDEISDLIETHLVNLVDFMNGYKT